MHSEINKFFRHEWILIREVDRTIAESARELVWTSGVRPQDAVHLATALAGDVSYEQFDTFDADLYPLSEKLGDPPLKIGAPNLPQKLPLDAPEQGVTRGAGGAEQPDDGNETKRKPEPP